MGLLIATAGQRPVLLHLEMIRSFRICKGQGLNVINRCYKQIGKMTWERKEEKKNQLG